MPCVCIYYIVSPAFYVCCLGSLFVIAKLYIDVYCCTDYTKVSSGLSAVWGGSYWHRLITCSCINPWNT